MSSPLRLARALLAFTITALGLALLAVTLAHGGGELGLILGGLFTALGAGRLYLLRRR